MNDAFEDEVKMKRKILNNNFKTMRMPLNLQIKKKAQMFEHVQRYFMHEHNGVLPVKERHAQFLSVNKLTSRNARKIMNALESDKRTH